MQTVMGGLGTDADGQLTLGGVNVPELAREYGTPLYLLDETVIRQNCREIQAGLQDCYPAPFAVAFASKALCFKALYKLLAEENMSADVVSQGELYTAVQGGFDPGRCYYHGNNKTVQELSYALEVGVRRIVVDNMEELERLGALAAEKGVVPEISFRVKPGIDAHTHEFVATGKIDSKFGLALENGEVHAVMAKAAAMPQVKVVGIHCHIGSQVFEAEPFRLAAKVMMSLIAELRQKFDLPLTELNLGGGFGIQYLASHDPISLRDMARICGESVKAEAQTRGMVLPELVLEPGRSITGPAGMTVYTIGSVKKIPGVNTYVAVDGGMTDNPRYALYGAYYCPVMPRRPHEEATQTVVIAGRCCESGDVITTSAALPEVSAGDLLAIQATGAYNYSMASHYNRMPNAPVVMVGEGKHRLVVRRETCADLLRNDI